MPIKLVVIDESCQIEQILRDRDDSLWIERIHPTSLTSLVQDHASFDTLIVVLNHSSSRQEVEDWITTVRQKAPYSCFVRIVTRDVKIPTCSEESDFVCELDELVRTVEKAMDEAEFQKIMVEKENRINQLEKENQWLTREVQDLNAIGEVARTISSTLLIDEILKGILNGICRVLSLNEVLLGLVNTRTGVEEVKLAVGVQGSVLDQAQWKVQNSDPIWKSLNSKQTPLVIETRSDMRLPRFAREIFQSQFVKIPLVVKGEIVGTIMAAGESEQFSTRDLRILQTFAEYAGVAVENGRLYYDVIRSEEELKETQKQLLDAERLAALGQLATSINHEINNPLCTISMTAQLLKIELQQKAPELTGRLDSIESGVERIMQVTERVAKMKKVQSTEYLPNQLMIDLK